MRRIPIDTLISSPEELRKLRELLAHGGVAAVPTETFYALAAHPSNEAAVRRIFRTKGRDDGKPLPVLFGAASQLEALGIVAPRGRLEHYMSIWPAPLTVALPLRAPIAASRGLSSLAVRLPASNKLRTILRLVGPLTGTSVNRSGSPAMSDPDEIEELFARSVDVLIDGGKTPGGKPSTIVDATVDPPALLREGAFAWPRER
ncbi:MAG TPA: L-threonylcarbamoyladenylate synthase [Thermoanaerobaculia bacterium]|nr:L-threonylcarbamoyladenylate synthase [Thermoanaerobaculia bacterium]